MALIDGIDTESQEFIDWAMNYLENNWDWFTGYVLGGLEAYYLNEGKGKTLFRLKEKMIEGAKNHGKPKLLVKEIEKEISMEALDLIGWGLMKKYRETKIKWVYGKRAE